MRSWSLDWLQQEGWQEDLADHARQRNLGAHLVHLFRQAISTNKLHARGGIDGERPIHRGAIGIDIQGFHDQHGS